MNGRATAAISLGSLISALGVGAVVVQDRLSIGDRLTELRVSGEERGAANRERIERLEQRISSLETPGGSTVMADETKRWLEALERRVERLEQREREGIGK